MYWIPLDLVIFCAPMYDTIHFKTKNEMLGDNDRSKGYSKDFVKFFNQNCKFHSG